MKFHHIGIATKDIDNTLEWVKKHYDIRNISTKVYDKNQNVFLQMVETSDHNIELVSGSTVEKFIKKNITYYHVCYEVEDIYTSIKSFSKSIVISKPTPAILFNNRKVAFLMTPIGIIELLELKENNEN